MLGRQLGPPRTGSPGRRSAFFKLAMSLQDYLRKYASEDTQEQESESEVSESEDGPVLVEQKPVSKGWTTVETKQTIDTRPKLMQDGSFAGLQTSDQIRQSVESKQRKLDEEKTRVNQQYDPTKVETVYRDASGKRVSMPQDPSADKQAEEERKREEIRKLNESEYTEIKKRQQQQRLEELRTETEKSKESQLKQTISEDDPALLFDTNVQTRKRKLNSNLSATGRKLYDETGYPDNRFGSEGVSEEGSCFLITFSSSFLVLVSFSFSCFFFNKYRFLASLLSPWLTFLDALEWKMNCLSVMFNKTDESKVSPLCVFNLPSNLLPVKIGWSNRTCSSTLVSSNLIPTTVPLENSGTFPESKTYTTRSPSEKCCFLSSWNDCEGTKTALLGIPLIPLVSTACGLLEYSMILSSTSAIPILVNASDSKLTVTKVDFFSFRKALIASSLALSLSGSDILNTSLARGMDDDLWFIRALKTSGNFLMYSWIKLIAKSLYSQNLSFLLVYPRTLSFLPSNLSGRPRSNLLPVGPSTEYDEVNLDRNSGLILRILATFDEGWYLMASLSCLALTKPKLGSAFLGILDTFKVNLLFS
ncbi:hypothetical protein OGAPHI_002113 [Ogataea philodendri]|uniref:Uncharacterized protein n=1 Tax=Ogataea philodendri TaxID=1378263 RepID=A0A9P8T7D5_9ASCO|nr:uncharacterized protein OGAPHI_002113 [Ogataea philodendri]KAH3668359.1 hypothetical protein OGAPHI_002113 [Ogataea philodendri]